MFIKKRQLTRRKLFKAICLCVCISFAHSACLSGNTFAQGSFLSLTGSGEGVALTPAFTPALVRGIKVYPDNPLQFDFIIDSGDSGLSAQGGSASGGEKDEFKKESEKLIRYFLASLTVPEDDLWVNLSPYESDRIVPDELGKTEMGIDMLAQDYLLKQITASLMNPEDDIGKQFWQKVYQQAYEQYGTTTIPVETFNKVWIMPDKAEVYVQDDRAFILEAKLKVMLEEDYVALQRSAESRALDARDVALENSVERIADSQEQRIADSGQRIENTQKLNANRSTLDANDAKRYSLNANNDSNPLIPNSSNPSDISTSIIRTIIIPALEREVNFGKNFAQLRQIYHSLILAHWYKTALKDSILNRVYADKRKVKGLESADSAQRIAHSQDPNAKPYTLNAVESIYSQYLATFKQGVHNMIKVEYDPYTKKHIPRKYFAGGLTFGFKNLTEAVDYALKVTTSSPLALLENHQAVTFELIVQMLPGRPGEKLIIDKREEQQRKYLQELEDHQRQLRARKFSQRTRALRKQVERSRDDLTISGVQGMNVSVAKKNAQDLLAELTDFLSDKPLLKFTLFRTSPSHNVINPLSGVILGLELVDERPQMSTKEFFLFDQDDGTIDGALNRVIEILDVLEKSTYIADDIMSIIAVADNAPFDSERLVAFLDVFGPRQRAPSLKEKNLLTNEIPSDIARGPIAEFHQDQQALRNLDPLFSQRAQEILDRYLKLGDNPSGQEIKSLAKRVWELSNDIKVFVDLRGLLKRTITFENPKTQDVGNFLAGVFGFLDSYQDFLSTFGREYIDSVIIERMEKTVTVFEGLEEGYYDERDIKRGKAAGGSGEDLFVDLSIPEQATIDAAQTASSSLSRWQKASELINQKSYGPAYDEIQTAVRLMLYDEKNPSEHPEELKGIRDVLESMDHAIENELSLDLPKKSTMIPTMKKYFNEFEPGMQNEQLKDLQRLFVYGQRESASRQEDFRIELLTSRMARWKGSEDEILKKKIEIQKKLQAQLEEHGTARIVHGLYGLCDVLEVSDSGRLKIKIFSKPVPFNLSPQVAQKRQAFSSDAQRTLSVNLLETSYRVELAETPQAEELTRHRAQAWIPLEMVIDLFASKQWPRFKGRNDIRGRKGIPNYVSQDIEERYTAFFLKEGVGTVSSNIQSDAPSKDNAQVVHGGIDFDTSNLNIMTRGDEIDFSFSTDLEGLDPDSIQGFIPVIIHMAPATNLHIFLGLEDAKDVYLSKSL